MSINISIYSTFVGSTEEWTSPPNPIEIVGLEISGDKLLDEQFFMFEGSTATISVVGETAELLRNMLFDASILVASFPPYKGEHGHKQPDALTDFLDKRVEISEDGQKIFIGSPQAGSISFNYKTGELSFVVASLGFIFLDNIDRIDSRILIDALIGDGSATQVKSLSSSFILRSAIDIGVSNGVKLSSLIPDDNIECTAGVGVSVSPDSPVLFYSEVEPMGVQQEFSNINFDSFSLHKKVGIGRPANKIDIRWHEIYEKKINIIYERRAYDEQPVATTADGVFWRFWGEAKIVIDTTNMSVKVDGIKYRNNNPSFYTSYNTATNTLYIMDNNAGSPSYFDANYIKQQMNSKPNISPGGEQSDTYAETFGSSGVIIHSKEKKVLAYGQFSEPIYNLGIKEGRFDASKTDGIFDASSNSLADILKYSLLGTGKYLQIKANSIDATVDIINLSGNVKILNMNMVTAFVSESFVFDIIKEFDSINFSSTDRHFVLRVFAMMYKNLSKQFVRKFSISIINAGQIEIGDIVEVNSEQMLVNEIERDWELFSIKCIKKA